MQQSGAAQGCGCTLLPLMGVLFFQGECAGWLSPTSGRGVREDGRYSASGWGAVSESPHNASGKEGSEKVWGGCFLLVITTHSVWVGSLPVLSWAPVISTTLRDCVVLWRWRDLIEPWRALVLSVSCVLLWLTAVVCGLCVMIWKGQF